MLKKNTHSINLKPIIQENNKDISFVCLLMKDEKGLQIRNQKKTYTPKEFEMYLRHALQADNAFFLANKEDENIGFFHIAFNWQHRLAQVYFTFLWDYENLPQIFSSSLKLLAMWLKDYHQIERITLPITGVHPDIDSLLLSCEEITQSIVLAQEHLDKDHQRQPVTFYDYFLS